MQLNGIIMFTNELLYVCSTGPDEPTYIDPCKLIVIV